MDDAIARDGLGQRGLGLVGSIPVDLLATNACAQGLVVFEGRNHLGPGGAPIGAAKQHAGIAARIAKRTPLAEKVPALVERHLELTQPRAVIGGCRSGRLALPERVLLGDELLDRSVDL